MFPERARTVLFALFGVALATSISAALIAAGLLIVDGLVAAARHRRWHRSPMDVPLAAYVGWGAVSALTNGSTGLATAISTQSAVAVFFLVGYASPDDRRAAGRWFVIAAAVVGAWGLVQVASGVNLDPNRDYLRVPDALRGWPRTLLHALAVRNDRAVGTRSHPLTYAEGFIAAAFLVVGWWAAGGRRRTPAAIAALVPMLAGALVAQGRGVWIGLAAGVLAFAVASRRREAVVAVLAGLAVGAAAFAASPGLRGRLLSTVSVNEGTFADQQSKSVRLTLWREAVGVVRAQPIDGAGLKGVKLRAIDPQTNEMRTWSEAHNIYLQDMADRGLVGFGLFLWLLAVAAALIRRSPEPWRSTGVAALVAFLVAGLTESWTKDKEIAMQFWGFLGAVWALVRERAVRA